MKTFREFITEIVATKRQNMIHLQKMKDIEYIEFVKEIKSKVGGKLDDIKITLKVDGLGARFGISKDGKPFFEGSRTGPIFEPKAFSTHAQSKSDDIEVITRAKHYDDIWDIITKSDFIKTLPNDTKVICEIFYNPMSVITDDGIKFVSIKYDKAKLGSLMTIVPINVLIASTGKTHPQSEEIIDNLLNQSDNKIKIVSPKLNIKDTIDITSFIDPVVNLDQSLLDIVTSRKKVDAEAKQMVKSIIQKSKDELANYILNHPSIVGKDVMGPDIEGLVLDIKGHQVKITTDKFKQAKIAEKQ